MPEGSGIIAIIIVLAVLGVIGGIGWFVYMKIKFRTVPSNEALIIAGPKLGDPEKETNIYKDDQGRYMKVVRGGGHRLRMFQTSTKVSLQSFQLAIKTPKVYTAQHVGVYGEAVATVKVADTLEGIVRYAEQFLGKKQAEIEQEIGEVLNSSLRAILSSMTVEEINGDRERFNKDVRDIAQKELNDMGFRITSLGLTDIADDEGYLENLGRPQIAEAKKTAEIAEANSRRETEIKQAQVKEEVSRETYQREMAIAEVKKTKDIKDAQILAETNREKAIAEAAYELEKEERRLGVEKQRIEIAEQEQQSKLRLLQRERENDVKLEQQQVEVQKQKAEADYLTKTKEAQARAAARKVEGEAEAAVIKQKNDAEIEAIEKRAEAMAKHQDVVLQEKLIGILPEYARAISESLSAVESIRIMDSGSGNSINALPNTVTNTMMKLQEGLGQMTGFDLDGMLNRISASKSSASPLSTLTEDNESDLDNTNE